MDIEKVFMTHYAPYTFPDFKPTVRSMDDLPEIDEPDGDKLRILANQVDVKRAEDAYIGAKLAGQELFENVIAMLKNDKGVQIEGLLAVIGAAGGHECMSGIIDSLNVVLTSGVSLGEAGGALSIYIAETKDGEKFLFGDRVGNQFAAFCMNAAKITEPPFEILKPLSEKSASCAGAPEYWETPFNKTIGGTPKELSEAARGKFETTFKVFCRYPQERMLAWAMAAQIAVDKAREIVGLDTAMNIIAEFGWRTSHYIGGENSVT